ncbi:MAG: L-aspartate oxidase [Ignavibacteria bacterium]|nr:L-aspartate oxidase [Ignavibacteria bacterium]
MTHQFDFLVLGSGVAGLTYALRVARHGSVAIITKKERAESNTNYAQGGVAAVLSQADSADLHMRDTLLAGRGLCREEAVRKMVKEGPARIRELVELGADFTRDGDEFDLAREGGHSVSRIVHAKDMTGREIERTLLDAVSSTSNITVFENHIAVDLLTAHQAEDEEIRFRSRLQCWGAYVLNTGAARVDLFLAKVVMLSTGGSGQVYLHTTNPVIATGDGIAMAYRAGARVANMEFIQFHPTTLFGSGSPSFLISEALRGFGALLRRQDGSEFMSGYDAQASLAPRDVVAYAIDHELKKRGEEFVLLDMTHLPAPDIRRRFPHIYETCRSRFRIDIASEPIPVVPGAHYCCGGVETDLMGRTNIRGLYAAGEVSMTGVHGANRLASNSLLEALVFSASAASDSICFQEDQSDRIPRMKPWDDSGTLDSEEWVLLSHDRKEIQQLMWDYVGIVRSDARLRRASRRIHLIREEIEQFYKRTRVVDELVQLRNLALCADLIIACSGRRKESRGLFRNTDYPERNDLRFGSDTYIDEETTGALLV